MKLGLLLSGAVKALDIQSQFRAYIDTAYPSCQAVIAKCERPFIGYDIKERVFSQTKIMIELTFIVIIALGIYF